MRSVTTSTPSKWRVFRQILAVVLGFGLVAHVRWLLETPAESLTDLSVIAGSVGAFVGAVAAFLLGRLQVGNLRSALLVFGTPLLAVILSPLVLLGLAGPLTAYQAGASAGWGLGYGFQIGLFLWSSRGFAMDRTPS